MKVNTYLTSLNGCFRVGFQDDGNLVVRKSATLQAVWASGTGRKTFFIYFMLRKLDR
jgi:hypothetical protein